jgi:hypothetical protein
LTLAKPSAARRRWCQSRAREVEERRLTAAVGAAIATDNSVSCSRREVKLVRRKRQRSAELTAAVAATEDGRDAAVGTAKGREAVALDVPACVREISIWSSVT